jgi:predicted Zn finger-like uncharacterized protein
MNEEYTNTFCPSCQARYRIAVEFLGRKISCKKCGNIFKLDFQDDNGAKELPQADPSEQEEIGKISKDDSLLVIGKMAIKYKFASVEQVNKALSIQEHNKKVGQKILLTDIMVENGMISQSQLVFLRSVQKMLETRKSDNRFGMIAVKNDFATQDQIEEALQEQKRIFKKTKTSKKIGDILVDNGVLTGKQCDAIILKQKRLEKSSPDEKTKSDMTGTTEPSGKDNEFELSISEDKLCAFIVPKEEVSITIDGIENFLKMKGIKYGTATDAQIAEYVNNKEIHNEPWKVAEGKPPKPGNDAKIKYFFETDPLKVGAIKDGGAIDFKDRGEIPQVKKGDLLAEKISVKKGAPGKDIYDKEIQAPKPKDIRLRRGKATTLSDDKLKVFANADGMPKVSALGEVYVLPKLEISGDVGLETGHVDFDGEIYVTGTIQNGFCVKGGSLTAKEILKAKIEMTGDIVVFGGIMGAQIKTDENIRAVYVHEADIEALGDVVVEKEILDSKIDTSGECIVKGGTILSSVVEAKKGIQVSQIGSEISKPCNMIVGADGYVKNKIDEVKEVISQKKRELKELRNSLKELEEMPDKIENEIGEMAQIIDRTMVKQRNLQKEMEEFKKAADSPKLANAEKELKELDLEIKNSEKTLEELFNQQDQNTEKISSVTQKIGDLEEEILDLKDKIAGITEWSANEKGIPEARVTDIIFQDTTIDGIHSSLTLKQNYKNVLIKESKIQNPDETTNWEIKILQCK